MDIERKLALLGAAARYDACACACSEGTAGRLGPGAIGDASSGQISHSVTPDGRIVSLLKVLSTNHCALNCHYCPNRRGNDPPRSYFSPEELARLFIGLYKRNLVEGLFLSSGIPGKPDATMEEMAATAEILRGRYGYRGYMHLKIVPGASDSAVEKISSLADRVSVNLEAPTRRSLQAIAPDKDLDRSIVPQLRSAHALSQERRFLPSGLTTQFVVGAGGESDAELLRTTQWLYRSVNLHRAFFSAFQPVRRTPLENLPATPLQREHRLYQAEWLLRLYGFDMEELPLEEGGFLPLELDPKHAWALAHPERFPVEVNSAPFEALLRVPGIGRTSARRIVSHRRIRRLRRLEDLKTVGAVLKRAAHFVTINGKRPPVPPAARRAEQGTLAFPA